MNDHRRDPFDLGLDFRDAVRPAPPTPWRAQALDAERTAPPPASQPAWAPSPPGSFPGTSVPWSQGAYDSRPAPALSGPQGERPRHIDSEACGVVTRSVESQILIPTARPSYKAGFDRRELKALAAAAVTGLTIAGAMAATLLHSSTPPPAPAAAVAVVDASPAPVAEPAADETPSLLAQLGETAGILAAAADELPAENTIDLDLDAEEPLSLDEEDEVDDTDEAEESDEEPRVSSSSRPSSSSRRHRRGKASRKKRADAKDEAESEKDTQHDSEQDEKPEAPKADGPLKVFNANAARSALSRAAGAASGCGQAGGPSGRARVSVTFASNGTVASASVSAPFAGTSTGRCIVGAFRSTTMTPFKGSSMSLSKSVFIRIPDGDADTTSAGKKDDKRKRSRRRRR